MTRGLFLSFEGGDGSGKSTQARLLESWLRERGIETVLAREPGGTAAGERIRQILMGSRVTADFDDRNGADANVYQIMHPSATSASASTSRSTVSEAGLQLAPEAEALLFNAARAELVREIVKPKLKAGATVILDRYFDSTLAYQGYGRHGNLKELRSICSFATGHLIPHRTFLLDLPVDVALKRRGNGSTDRFEVRARAFHERVRDGYLRLAVAEPGRFVVISADQDEQLIAADIRREVDALLGAPA